MAMNGDERENLRVPSAAAGPVPIELLRNILGRDSAALAIDARSLPRLLADPRFQELVEIVDLAVQVHGEHAREWFGRPEPELGFVLPATLMRDPANGRRLVKQSLINHLRGVYAVDGNGRVLPEALPALTPAPRAPGRIARRPKARPRATKKTA